MARIRRPRVPTPRRLVHVVLVAAIGLGGGALAPASALALEISEFRVRGPNGANDEFVELYNESSSPLTVSSAPPSTGWSVAASDGVPRFIIPNGTVIPAHGHYLGVNAVGYTLGGYAAGDVPYTADILDNAGIALFKTSVPADFTLANRLDAVGSTAEANTLYREGTGYPALTPFSIEYGFYRDLRAGAPQDTNSNAGDFLFVDTNGVSAGAGQRLGAPGPENLSSPVADSAGTAVSVEPIDPTVAPNAPPNQVRDTTGDAPNNSTFGTLDIRRTITNTSGRPISRLRFRVTDLTTSPSPAGIADLRPRTSTAIAVALIGGSVATVQGTALEMPPSQPIGGGFNSSFSAGGVTLASPLAPGASVNLRFLLGIQQTGTFRFCALVEGRPVGGNAVSQTGNTETNVAGNGCATPERKVAVSAGPPPATPAASVAPAAASFTGSRSSVRVDGRRRFRFSFGATQGLTGRAVFKSVGKVRVSRTGKRRKRVTLAGTAFTVPAGGRVVLGLRLSRKGLRILNVSRRIRTRVTVTLRNATGQTSTARATITLNAPRRRGG